jgi:uncharacterized membrane protein
MKRIMILASVLCLVIVVGGNVQGSMSVDAESNSDKSVLAKERTFLSGMILNPTVENSSVSAKALQLFYYTPSIFIDEIGIVKGLTQVSFTKGNFILVWTPGPFGFIGYVLGFCTDFEIQ